MIKSIEKSDKSNQNKERFHNELKIYVNQKLYEKKLISEDMYWAVKELLHKQIV